MAGGSNPALAVVPGGGGRPAPSSMSAMPAAQNNYSPAFASSALGAALPGGVNDPFLTSAPSQAIAAATNPSYTAPPSGFRPVMRPDGDRSSDLSFGADLSRSLSDPNYDPPGNVISRALGTVSPNAREGDSLGGGK